MAATKFGVPEWVSMKNVEKFKIMHKELEEGRNMELTDKQNQTIIDELLVKGLLSHDRATFDGTMLSDLKEFALKHIKEIDSLGGFMHLEAASPVIPALKTYKTDDGEREINHSYSTYCRNSRPFKRPFVLTVRDRDDTLVVKTRMFNLKTGIQRYGRQAPYEPTVNPNTQESSLAIALDEFEIMLRDGIKVSESHALPACNVCVRPKPKVNRIKTTGQISDLI